MVKVLQLQDKITFLCALYISYLKYEQPAENTCTVWSRSKRQFHKYSDCIIAVISAVFNKDSQTLTDARYLNFGDIIIFTAFGGEMECKHIDRWKDGQSHAHRTNHKVSYKRSRFPENQRPQKQWG